MSNNAPVKISVVSTLFGPFSKLGEDGVRGVKVALEEFGGQAGGREIIVSYEGTIGDPQTTGDKISAVLNSGKADIVVGPLSGNEGLRLKQIAKSHPKVTFLNGASGAQELTFPDTVPNFFNFTMNGAQLMAGIGTYAYQEMGLRNVAIIGEKYSYPFAQAGGFMVEFCRLGGKVIHKTWVALGTKNYENIIDMLPDTVDAIVLLLGGSDVVSFLKSYGAKGHNIPILAGVISAEHNVLNNPEVDNSILEGIITSGMNADDNPLPAWHQFLDAYHAIDDKGFAFPTYFASGYYNNFKAALMALEATNGDLSALGETLATLQFEGPCGTVQLDGHHGVIATNYITRIARHADGIYYRQLVAQYDHVSQFLGMPEDDFLALGTFDETNPSCP